MPGLFGEWRKKHQTKKINKALCERYPFLIPWNRFTGKFIKSYDYSFTELDSMEDGWRNAFGLKMCEEIRDALKIGNNRLLVLTDQTAEVLELV